LCGGGKRSRNRQAERDEMLHAMLLQGRRYR
jgi:hypothetical protein